VDGWMHENLLSSVIKAIAKIAESTLDHPYLFTTKGRTANFLHHKRRIKLTT
jgi:hypothetical protein